MTLWIHQTDPGTEHLEISRILNEKHPDGEAILLGILLFAAKSIRADIKRELAPFHISQ